LYDDAMSVAGIPTWRWKRGLEARHLATLTFPEVRRALQALSSLSSSDAIGS